MATLQNFPAALVPIIQTNYLEKKFYEALRAKLAFRAVATREPFPARDGETYTKTRTGLRPAQITPLVPSAANANFDNGLTSSVPGVEQYTISIAQYADTVDLNIAQDTVGIASQFVMNGEQLAESAIRTLDTLACNALFNAYLGGNTRITASATTTTPAVDDIRGFQNVWVNGVLTPVSGTNPLTVTINGASKSVTAATPDGSNVSTAPGGISGTLTIASTAVVSGQAVIASTAPSIVRPNARATTAALTTGDTLPMITGVLQAVTNLRMNNVPTIGGAYNCYLDPQQLQGLFSDTAFQTVFRGAYESREYKQGEVFTLMGVRFIPNNLSPQQAAFGSVPTAVHRAIVCGAGALIEGDASAAMAANEAGNPLSHISYVDGIKMVTRAPMDRLQQIVAQSWNWIGGFCVPSDTTVSSTVLPTATNAAYKRAVVVESL
jgi:hypothetical protein